MRRLFFILAGLLVISLLLSACGSPATQQASSSDESSQVKHYEPEGPTVHFNKVGNTVNVSLSHYVGESPTEPVQVIMTGEKDSETDGLVVSFPWKQEETYKPELLNDFDKLCTYRWTATIDGKKAITQHIEEFEDACWIEFVFLP